MSGVPLSWHGNLPPLLAAPQRERARAAPDKLTFQGLVLFIVGLSIATSAFERFRVGMGGLQVHLYLFLMAPFLVYLVATNLKAFPPVPLASLLVFCGMYIISTFSGGMSPWSEILKISASGATVIFGALMVRTPTDFRAGVVGLIIAIGFLAFFSLETADRLGANVMETGNKNAYSLYALPAMLLAGSLLVKKKSGSLITKAILLVCTFGPLVVIFMGANRSGWAGCAVVGLMLMVMRGFNARGALVVAVLGYSVFYAITEFGTTSVFTYRLQQTLKGTRSDENRKVLLANAIEIGLENPVVGVSPQYLPVELGRRLQQNAVAASHNVVGQIIGGSGLLCFAAIICLAVSLWRLKPQNHALPLSPEFKDARKLLRMMVVLWAFRGFFTGEILYSPSFSLSVGLAIGLCIAIEQRDQARHLASFARPTLTFAGARPLPPNLAT